MANWIFQSTSKTRILAINSNCFFVSFQSSSYRASTVVHSNNKNDQCLILSVFFFFSKMILFYARFSAYLYHSLQSKSFKISFAHEITELYPLALFLTISKRWEKHWIMKASLPEVNQFTGNCFRILRIVSKNNFLVIKISQPTPLDYFSVL